MARGGPGDRGTPLAPGSVRGLPMACAMSPAIVDASAVPLPASVDWPARIPPGVRLSEMPAATIVAAPAKARTRRGRKPTNRPRRIGSSMKRWLTAATTIETPARTSRVRRESSASRAAAGMSRIGQCQR